MINKLLTTCLKRNKRLILPTLGAFIRKNIDGIGVILVFVPFLKNDDGILLSAIKSWAGVEDEEAKQILDEYIAAIKDSLDTRGQYLIEGVGVLKYDVNHIICLDKGPVINNSSEQTNSEETQAPVAQPAQETPPQAVAPQVEAPIEPIEPEQAPQIEPQTPQPESTPSVEAVVETAPNAAESEVKIEQDSVVFDDEDVSLPVDQESQVKQPFSQPIAQKPTVQPQPAPQPAPQPNPFHTRHSQNFDPLKQRPADMGARYFSPRSETTSQPREDVPTSPVQRERRTNSDYASSQRADVNSMFSRGRDQSRINNIYSGSAGQTSNGRTTPPAQSNTQRPGVAPRDRVRGSQPTRPTTPPVKRPVAKGGARNKKSNDIVLWIAIIAVVLTVIVLVYGFLYGGNQTLEPMFDDMEMIQPDGDSL